MIRNRFQPHPVRAALALLLLGAAAPAFATDPACVSAASTSGEPMMEPASRLAPKDGAIAGPGGDAAGCASATDSAGLADDPMVAGSESTLSGTINPALSGIPSGSAYAYPTAIGASPLAIGVTPLALGVNTFPASGNVGIGTDTPLKTLHMVNNNTPTIRFEQVAGGGYIPYTWDIGANESNFFVRDQTGGERLPFRMAPGNASNTLTLKNSSVGIGTWDPQSALHVIGKVQVSSLISCGNGVTSDSNGVLGCALAAGGLQYFSVNSSVTGAGSNAANDGATGTNAIAVGMGATASSANGSAFGSGAFVTAGGSTAIGYQAVAHQAGVVSFGHAVGDLAANGTPYATALTPRLVNVGAGVAATDAVNKGQLDGTLATAIAYTDQREAAIRADITATGAASNAAYTDAREAAVRTDMAAADAQTLASANSYTDTREAAIRADMGQIGAVAIDQANAYTDTRETAIRTDMAAGDATTLAAARTYADTSSANAMTSANAYTDTRFTAWNDRFTQYQQAVDQRFVATDERISQMGAMSSAMTQMTANAVPAQAGNGRMAIGVGTQSGKAALSVGYGKRLPGGASFTFGASFSGGENSAGAGFGFDL